MRSKAHAVAALPLAGAWWGLDGGAGPALAAALASVLVDLDHVSDYLWWRGGWRGLKDFFHSFHTHRVTRLALLAHSWELIAVAGLGLWWGGWPVWPAAIWAGWAYHLAWDQASNPVGWPFYFLVYRLAHGCDRRNLPVIGGSRGLDTRRRSH
ncbi:MAG: hypothetical protein V1797_18855 [Pseudomonadota bacterium]